jgi:hypothetical protein
VELGATHWNVRPDVRRLAENAVRRVGPASWNTYEGHPWPGWDAVSVDFWGPAGRGAPIRWDVALAIRRYLMNRPGEPYIRHTILGHTLWTSFGGESIWTPNDHSGHLRHLHVTWWLTK